MCTLLCVQDFLFIFIFQHFDQAEPFLYLFDPACVLKKLFDLKLIFLSFFLLNLEMY